MSDFRERPREQPRADVRETSLPGIGVRHELDTGTGQRLGVVSHRSGRRELCLYDSRDPDAAAFTVVLAPEEAEAVAAILGAPRITRELTELPREVEGLVVEWLKVPQASSYAGATLGDTRARTRTGASVVALVRDGVIQPSPGPGDRLVEGDTLVVVGTPHGVEAVQRILEE